MSIFKSSLCHSNLFTWINKILSHSMLCHNQLRCCQRMTKRRINLLELKTSWNGSYANRLNGDPSNKVANFRILIAPAGNWADIAVSKESILQVKERFNNTVYGFFLGKSDAYPVVEKYVKNAWSRFGLVRSMMNSKGIFFFKFNLMLENGKNLVVYF